MGDRVNMSIRSLRRNLPYLQNELKALLGNLSNAVKCICFSVICSYALSFYQPAVEVLSVKPGNLLPPNFHVWTLFTSPFLETHFFEVCIDIITIGLCGKLLEPLWGAREMLFFFFYTNTLVAILSVTYYLLLYSVTFDPDILFDINIHGLSGYVAAVSVSVRQAMPDHVLFKTPFGKLTNRNVPLTVLTLCIIMWAIGLGEGPYCTMFAFGIIISWVYLRFFQKHKNGSRGDMTESFSFSSFFPNVLQPFISVISNSIYQFLVKLGICRKQVKRFNDGPSSINISLPAGTDPTDGERRRQKALRALSERLGREESAKRPLIRPESPSSSDRSERGSIDSPSPIPHNSGQMKSSQITNQSTILKNTVIPEMTIDIGSVDVESDSSI